MMYCSLTARAPRGALWRASEASASVPGTPARRPGAACSLRDASSTTMSRSMSLQSSARPAPREPTSAAPSTAGSARRLAVAALSQRDRMLARRGAGGPALLTVTERIIARRKPPGNQIITAAAGSGRSTAQTETGQPSLRPKTGIYRPGHSPHTRSGVSPQRQKDPQDQQLDLQLADNWSQNSPTEPDTRKCHRCTQNRAFSRRSRSTPPLQKRTPMEARWAASRPWNVTPWTYRVIVREYTLPEVPRPRRRYEVTVTLPRPTDVEALLPGGQAAVDMRPRPSRRRGC